MAMVILLFSTSVFAKNLKEIIVDKTSRTLWLVSDSEVLREFKISLGPNPDGHKLEKGDGKTPEGTYSLTWKKSDSAYYKSIHINYPNSADRLSASSRGVSPGGSIKIHGLPNNSPFDAVDHLAFDWTEGCISVSNEAIDVLWNTTPTNTKIHIYKDLFNTGLPLLAR
jgi:murein L,D-transpeptidase YafK